MKLIDKILFKRKAKKLQNKVEFTIAFIHITINHIIIYLYLLFQIIPFLPSKT